MSDVTQGGVIECRGRLTLDELTDHCNTYNKAPQRYRTVVADPPWQYGGSVGRTTAWRGHAQAHYDSMPLAAICALEVPADDSAHLWIWGVNGMLDAAYTVARAWDFKPVTLLTWCKKQPGVGKYLRNNTEHCLLATRGEYAPPVKPSIASWYVWPRAEHSAKPDAFYDLVETLSPEPRLEMFSRRSRFGWDTHGNEALGNVEIHHA